MRKMLEPRSLWRVSASTSFLGYPEIGTGAYHFLKVPCTIVERERALVRQEVVGVLARLV